MFINHLHDTIDFSSADNTSSYKISDLEQELDDFFIMCPAQLSCTPYEIKKFKNQYQNAVKKYHMDIFVSSSDFIENPKKQSLLCPNIPPMNDHPMTTAVKKYKKHLVDIISIVVAFSVQNNLPQFNSKYKHSLP